MKNKKKIALNSLFNFAILCTAFSVWIAVDSFRTGDIEFFIISGVIALLILSAGVVFTPCVYIFDSEGLTLRYVFCEERYLWENISEIEMNWERFEFGGSPRANLLDLFFPSYSVYADCEGKLYFFMSGNIRKTLRTKHLIKKYWDGEITGYFFEDAKKAIDKRRRKKKKYIAAHLTDEIVPMEREARAKAREWLKPYEAELRQMGLTIRCKYVYTVDGWDEYNSRPDEGYNYTLVIEISRPDEKDEKRIVVFSEDLLYVRLGKTAYRGVENNLAEELLQQTLTRELREIAKIGFEEYINK
ncbi:MAG: hypothetical protein IJA55_05335 [Clostridia bacterium]|nr:hypothetical protein [Clostridia bacterium]